MLYSWTCGMNVPGTLGWRWVGDWVEDYEECAATGRVDVEDDEDPTVECHECGAYLEDPSHFTRV